MSTADELLAVFCFINTSSDVFISHWPFQFDYQKYASAEISLTQVYFCWWIFLIIELNWMENVVDTNMLSSFPLHKCTGDMVYIAKLVIQVTHLSRQYNCSLLRCSWSSADELEHRLSALIQLHLYSRLKTWLQWIGQRQLQDQKLSFGIWCDLC